MRCVFLILWMSCACLAETPSSVLTGKRRAQAQEWLLAADSDTRRKAHQALSQLSDREKSVHQELLAEAKKHHLEAFQRLLKESYVALKGYSRGLSDWTRQCEDTLAFAQRELGKKKDALSRLGRMRDRAAAAYRQIVEYDPKAEKIWDACESQAKIVLELEMEMALLQGDEEKAFALDLEGVFEKEPYGDNLLAIRNEQQLFAKQQQHRRRTERYNQKTAPWPSDAQRDFARVFNEQRAHLGLSTLYLQKELCQTSLGHSQEMQRLGYFSHTSPTPKNRSFVMRAANARYPGRIQGENIYMGSHSAEAAFEAWWDSDGHRRIMLEASPNHLGIGMHKAYWTMNVGRGHPPKDANLE